MERVAGPLRKYCAHCARSSAVRKSALFRTSIAFFPSKLRTYLRPGPRRLRSGRAPGQPWKQCGPGLCRTSDLRWCVARYRSAASLLAGS